MVCFESFLDTFAATGVSNLIITGDFNFPHINWSTGSPIITDNLTESFCNILDDHFLTQMNFHVTRMSSSSSITGNILDLVFTNFESLVEDVVVFPHAFELDHFPITFTLKRKFNRQKNMKRMVYSYKNADLEGLHETLNCIPWEFVISSSDLNDSVTKFQDLLLSAIAEHVPLITLRGRSRPPWITFEVMKLVRKKKALWKRWKCKNSPELFS